MKKLLFIVLIVIAKLCQAQDTLVVIIRPALNLPVSSFDPASLEQIPSIPDNEPTKNMYTGDNPIVYKDNMYIIRFYNLKTKKLIKIGQVDAGMSVEVVANGKTYQRSAEQNEIKMTDLNLDFKKLFNNEVIPQKTSVKISVNINNTNYKILNTILETEFFNPRQHYQSLGQDLGGFWIPTLLYSTNFKSTNEGIPFASLPIGIAYGWKFFGKKGGYIGVSGMGNWLIYNQPSTSSTTVNSSFNLQAITGGVLFDFSDVVSLGCVYGKDFRSNGSDPGLMFVLGIGSKALSFFKKDKEPKSTESFSIRSLR